MLKTILASLTGLNGDRAVLETAVTVAGLETACNLSADLLVMGAYGHNRLREAVFESVTRSMLSSCDTPVLMIH